MTTDRPDEPLDLLGALADSIDKARAARRPATDRPDDRADVVDAASVFIASRVQRMHPRELATSMHQAGLLVSPADQDAYQRGFEAAWTDAQRDIDAIKDREDQLRAQVAAVRALRDNWARLAVAAIDPDTREWLTAVVKSLTPALDMAGGEQQ